MDLQNNGPAPTAQQAGEGPGALYNPQGAPFAQAAPQIKRPRREYTAAERVLLPIALLVAVLFDRLMVAAPFSGSMHYPFFAAIFWLTFLVIYYAVFWKRLKCHRTLWLVGGLTGMLCVWNFLFDYRSAFGALTYFVVPAVLMAHTQFLAGDYKLKEVGKIAQAWLLGWLVRPFSAINHFAGATGSALSGSKQSQIKKIAIGVGIALPLLLVIIPLLGSADRVFAWYIERFVRSFSIASLIGHLFVVAVALILFYSFLWNIGFAGPAKMGADENVKQIQVDAVISCIVLGSIVAVYVLFCSVQFTYLFARAGLPGEMTYSEYAREGFAQMIVICGINLLIFGIFLQFGKRHKATSALLGALLALTVVMLVSSFVRLNLYIGTYGLTWLRLLSGWFILYLAVVLLLCGLRMVRPAVPLIAICSLLLLGWYVVLGYANPDGLVAQYNLRAAPDHSAWLSENRSYVLRLSDNAMLTLLDSDVEDEVLAVILEDESDRSEGYSLSSYILHNRTLR